MWIFKEPIDSDFDQNTFWRSFQGNKYKFLNIWGFIGPHGKISQGPDNIQMVSFYEFFYES